MSNCTHTLKLKDDHQLLVERNDRQDLIRLVGPEGGIRLSIVLTSEGPVLHFEAAGLLLQASGTLAIDAERVSINSRKEMVLTSGGSAQISAVGNLETEGRIQTIRSTLGDVKVRANDDVRLNGERILLNC